MDWKRPGCLRGIQGWRDSNVKSHGCPVREFWYSGGDVDVLLAQRLKRIPLGFMGDGRDSASAALFLASDDARFITGTEIVVDGGMTARCD